MIVVKKDQTTYAGFIEKKFDSEEQDSSFYQWWNILSETSIIQMCPTVQCITLAHRKFSFSFAFRSILSVILLSKGLPESFPIAISKIFRASNSSNNLQT